MRHPLGLAMLMPDTQQKQGLPKRKQLQQRERKIRSQKPIPFLEVSLEAKEAQHAVFSIMDVTSARLAPPPDHAYI